MQRVYVSSLFFVSQRLLATAKLHLSFVVGSLSSPTLSY